MGFSFRIALLEEKMNFLEKKRRDMELFCL
jgi:hypothetical protein